MKRKAIYHGEPFSHNKMPNAKLQEGMTGIAHIDFIVEGDGIAIYLFVADADGSKWHIEEKNLEFPEPNVEVA